MDVVTVGLSAKLPKTQGLGGIDVSRKINS